MPRGRGELEQQLMETLWRRPDGMSARHLVDELPGSPLALTTVLTVLERLREKGMVDRDGDRGTGYTYRPVSSQSEHVVQAMLDTLTSSHDRQQALVSFAGRLDDTDVRLLREALSGRTRKPR